MDYGYMGKIMRINLSMRTHEIDTIESDTKEKYIGGRGLGIWLLAKETQADVDPYAEENNIIFMTGPYTGTGVFSAFYNVTTKSPLTGIAASSHAGGTYGPMLKRAGYDALIITGKAEQPTYLHLKDGTCHFLEAMELWGRGVKETDSILREHHGRVTVAAIGPAGENLVRFASVMNDIHRAAGRGGVGAVMGSKNLKAIVVGGKEKIYYHNRKRFNELSRSGGKKAILNAPAFAKYGTSGVFSLMNKAGALPTHNFRAGHFKYASEIDGENLKAQYFIKDKRCFKCPLKCANIHTVPEGPYQVEETEGPEYETLMAFGSNCGNTNLASIIKANDLCNDFGMDTISTGNTIALLFDLYERGLVDNQFSKGLDLNWGNADTILRLIHMIAHRRELGTVLAEGSVRAANYFGKECERYVMHAKNQDFPGYEIRRAKGTGLSFATSSRGACHLRASFYVNEIFTGELDPYGLGANKVELLVEKENFLALVDSLVMCKFGQRNGEFSLEIISAMLTYLTGHEYTPEELLKVGERIYNLERIYNDLAGVGPDVLPDRLFEESLDDSLDRGGNRIDRNEFEEALLKYYRVRGWDASSKPANKKLEELGLLGPILTG
jgi:aldehyde:ferredoxin oxidoreductase